MLNIISKETINNKNVYFYNIKTLKYASGFFNGDTNITSFNDDLSSVIKGNNMFNRCFNLTTFKSNLHNLQEADGMFTDCKNMTDFEVKCLDSLISANNMFKNCRLFEFVCNLPSLKNGDGMFDGCPLETFIGDLSSLETGVYMFRSCKLSPLSVTCIESSLPKVKSAKITIGISVPKSSSSEVLDEFAQEAGYDDWTDLKSFFVRKGWNATFLYKGNDTAITYGLRNTPNAPIYVKLEEVEIVRDSDKQKAEYCSEDGKKFYNLDWCNDACDTSEYTLFNSLTEACEHFGIIQK